MVVHCGGTRYATISRMVSWLAVNDKGFRLAVVSAIYLFRLRLLFLQ